MALKLTFLSDIYNKLLPEAIVLANISSFYQETKVNIKSYFYLLACRNCWTYIDFSDLEHEIGVFLGLRQP